MQTYSIIHGALSQEDSYAAGTLSLKISLSTELLSLKQSFPIKASTLTNSLSIVVQALLNACERAHLLLEVISCHLLFNIDQERQVNLGRVRCNRERKEIER